MTMLSSSASSSMRIRTADGAIATINAAAQTPVTPMTATALQYRWTQTQLMPEPSEVELKKRIASTPRVGTAPTPVIPSTIVEEDEEDDTTEIEDEEPKVTPWQSTRDLPERRLMVQRIITLTEKRRPVNDRRRDRHGEPVAAASAVTENASALAKRIELSLYSRAGSLDEYKNTVTLRRRLQSLVSLSFHEANAAKDANAANDRAQGATGKRRSSGDNGFAIKRRRLTVASSSMIRSHTHNSGRILGSLSEDCIRSVFSFLGGCEVLSLRTINRFAAEFLPTCVLTLEVEVARFHVALTRSSTLLMRMTHLESLVVFKKTNPCAEPTSVDQKLALHAWGCTELDVTHDNVGEIVVQHLARAMDAGACARLKQLQLVSTFTNTSRRNGLRALCTALARRACPLLEDLLLGGNSITDIGTVDIARLLKSRALPQLMRLDLRRNYIGETGLQRIMTALAATQPTSYRLKYLCMGGNLITDNCVKPLTEMLARGVCPQMRFLGLEDNFLSPAGVQTIIRAALSGGMVPKLHRVASDGSVTP